MGKSLRFFTLCCLCALAASARGQMIETAEVPPAISESDLPDAPAAQAGDGSTTPATAQDLSGKQTKRILFIIPNFRAVSVDERLPPLSAGQKFKLMMQDSFDYSSFIWVGIVAGIGQWQDSYPEFHQGAAGYGRYYWHAFADNLNGNAFTEFIMPVATRQDPRYYTLGRGGFGKRTVYSVGRLFITRTDSGGETFNFSEVVGNGAASGISNLYYPSRERTWTKTGQKWLVQLGVDGISNFAKEFWPDVNQHVFHNKY